MFTKSRLFCAVLGAAAVMGAGVAQADDAMKIGFIEAITGPAAAYGDNHRKGTRLAIDEINAAGGVNGKPIEIVAEDDRSDPVAGINAAKKLITREKVDVIVGSPASLVTIAFSKENERYKVPVIVGQAGSPTVTEQGYKYTWRVNMTDAQLDSKAVEFFAKEKGVKNFAFLVENSDYGKPPTKAASDAIKAAGANVTAYEEYNRGETDFKAQLSKIKETSPEIIFVHGYYTEGSIIARQIKELGIDATLILNQGQGVNKFVELAGDASNGAIFPTPWLPGLDDEKSKKFEAAFKAKYGHEAGPFEASTYDAVQVLIEAVKRGGGHSPAQIQEGMAKMDGFSVLMGEIHFDDKHQNQGDVRLAVFKDGKIVPYK